MITADTEKRKYEKMWAVKAYRSNSPGEQLVKYFLDHIDGYLSGETLIDLGCGTGRAGLKLSAAGFDVTLLDHCEAALDDKVRLSGLPFIEMNLWELPNFVPFNWFYCTDVMEHLPTDKVNRVLANCAKVAKRGFFQIAMFEDGFGDQIGECLHLTVKPESWWRDALNEHFKIDSLGILSYKRLVAFVRSKYGE